MQKAPATGLKVDAPPLRLDGHASKQVAPDKALKSSQGVEKVTATFSGKSALPGADVQPRSSKNIVAAALPPRPHSVADIRPKVASSQDAPQGRDVAGPSRPVSVHLTGEANWLSNPAADAPGPSKLSQMNKRRDMQRQLSREDGTKTRDPNVPVNFPGSSNGNERERVLSGSRQRPIVTSIKSEGEEPVRTIRVASGLGPSRKQKDNSTSLDHPPRPNSAASDRPTFMRPKGTRSNKVPDSTRDARPISATSETLEQYGPLPVESAPSKTPSRSVQSATTPQEPWTVPRPLVSLPAQTPSGGFERPTVVYLPSTENEAPRPRAQKTWSLAYQLELLNKKKRLEDAKVESDLVVPIHPVADEPMQPDVQEKDKEVAIENHRVHDEPKPSATPVLEQIPTLPQPEVESPAQSEVSSPTEAIQNKKADTEKDIEPVKFPTQEEEKVASAPAHKAEAQAKQPQTSSNFGASTRSRVVSNASSNGAVKGNSKSRVVSGASKAVPTVKHFRNASADVKDSMKMPVKVPTQKPPQTSGFVPKRNLKSSVTQPTKAQEARAQALKNEKNASQATTKSTSLSSSVKGSGSGSRPPSRPASRLNDVDKQSSGVTRSRVEAKHVDPTPSITDKMAVQNERPRKPPVPTTSSLVKMHAAKREAGLSKVTVRMGGQPAPKNINAPKPKVRGMAPVHTSKRIVRAVQENDAARSQSEAAQGLPPTSTGLTALLPTPSNETNQLHLGSSSQAHNTSDILPASERASTGTGLRNKEELSLVVELSEGTLPTPSSSFAIGGERNGTA
jgi:hypothetical protein